MQTYTRLPVTFSRGEGVWLWDNHNNKYLDAIAGIAVCGLGHAHPAVTETICQQAKTLIHTSNLFQIEAQDRLANQLCALAEMDRAFFCNSGAEANEAAIKLARLYGHSNDILNPAIVVMEGSFHGRTLATLTASGNRKIQAGFEPLMQGFIRVPYNDIGAVKKVAQHNSDVVAILVEPVLGESGIIIPDRGYLQSLRSLCDDQGWLLMVDEIQTGLCRSGRWFAWQHEDTKPDVMTLAKSLGNGLPIGACLAQGKAAEVLQPGKHGSTFGGNPLACQVALTVIETMAKDKLAQRAADMGKYLLSQLDQTLSDIDGIVEIRGRGLLLAIELDRPCQPLSQVALDHGLVVNVTAEKIVRLLPPLILNRAEADQICQTLGAIIPPFLEQAAA